MTHEKISPFLMYIKVHKTYYLSEKVYYYTLMNIPKTLVVFLLCAIICLGLLIISYIASQIYEDSYTEKLINFECGFDPFSDTKTPFNVKFFLIIILFLIFDVEILFLLPWLLYNETYATISRYLFYFFLYILFVGFYYEYKSKSLSLE